MPEFSRNQKIVLVAIIGLAVLGLALKLARNTQSRIHGDIVLTEPAQQEETSKVIFQVAGCVNKPGVFNVAKGTRIIEGIKLAGGPTADADLESLNLAAKIEDGSKIYIPSKSVAPEATAVMTMPAASKSPSSSRTSSSNKLHNPGDGKVNINTADENELQRLPGVGPSTAQAILDYRSKIRRFSSVDQLDDVKGIGPKKLDKMRPFICL
ncbi:MAG: helix-hairpin-helix domain-containing protein [Armatimonadota bacterium]